MSKMSLFALLHLGAVAAMMSAGIAAGAEVKVIGSPGTRAPYTLLVPDFEKASGIKVATIWGGVGEVAKRVAGGEVADLVMLPAAQIDELIAAGKLDASTRRNVATSGVGVAIRTGVPRIDISSADGCAPRAPSPTRRDRAASTWRA
jgi:molybdate transport system substrate-binding protein